MTVMNFSIPRTIIYGEGSLSKLADLKGKDVKKQLKKLNEIKGQKEKAARRRARTSDKSGKAPVDGKSRSKSTERSASKGSKGRKKR